MHAVPAPPHSTLGVGIAFNIIDSPRNISVKAFASVPISEIRIDS